MDVLQKIEQLKFTIGRFDHYYDSVNNKGNVYLTLNIFILGGIVTAFYSLNNAVQVTSLIKILFYGICISNMVSTILTLKAIRPYVTKTSNNPSAIYFADIAGLSGDNFKNLISSLTPDKLLADLTNQAHLLAIGLKKKFEALSLATDAMMVQLVLGIVFGFLILNLK